MSKPLLINKEITILMDSAEREAAMSSFHDHNGDFIAAKTIKDNIVDPLCRWAEAEYKRSGHMHTGIEAAQELALYADDLAEKWGDSTEVVPEQLERLESLWRDFVEVIGAASTLQWDKHYAKDKARGKKSGEAKKGKESRMTKTIRAMFEDMIPGTCNSYVILAEFEADADEGEGSMLDGLREEGRAFVKIVEVTGDGAVYKEIGGRQGKSLSISSLNNTLTKFRKESK